MMEFERHIQEMLEAEAARIPAADDVPRGLRLRYRRRRTMQLMGGLVGVAVLSTAAIGAVGLVNNPDSARRFGVADEPTEAPYECPQDDRGPRGLDWTSPVVEVGRGSYEGDPWLLCARTATHTSAEKAAAGGFKGHFTNEAEARTSDENEDALCMHWQYGSALGSGMDCFSGSDSLSPDQLDVAVGENEAGQPNLFYGAIPRDTASIEVHYPAVGKNPGGRLSSDTDPNIQIIDAPEELGVEFRFLVAFIGEPGGYVTDLIARDHTGEEIKRRSFFEDPAKMRVFTIGDGSGTITAIDEAGEPLPDLIQCKDNCTTVVPAGVYRFMAEPDEGSHFDGWAHSCVGRQKAEFCEVVVNMKTHISAVFVLEKDSPTPDP